MSPFENADYGGTQPSIDNIGGLDFTTMTNNEIIRKKDNDEAEGAGHIIEDQVAGENYIKKLYNRINASPFSIPLGGILHSYNILTSIYKTQIAPKTSSLGSSEGLFIKSSFSDGNVDIGINVLDPQTELDVKGDIQLGNVTPKLKFGKIAPGAHALAEIKAVLNDTNGGDLQFLTKVDGVVGSAVTEKLRINDLGAVGFGGANFGTDGQVLTSKGNGAVPEWVTRVYSGIQCNNTKNGVSRQSITFTTQVQSGITATSAGFTATSNGWYNLTYNFATISSGQWAYSYIYIKKNGTNYFNSEFKDAGSPWEHDAPHGGGMLIQLNNGDTITFEVEVDVGGNYNVNGYASLIKM